MTRVKGALASLAFGGRSSGPSAKGPLDAKQALAIPFGGDSFQLIGHVSLDAARAHLLHAFPEQEAASFVIPDNPAKDAKFAERDIDLVRVEREKALEDYRRQLHLKYDMMSQS